MAKKTKTKNHRVEIVRSFSFKLNLGNYQNIDVFCSEKSECAPKDAEKTSEALYQFCKSEVLKSVNQIKKAQADGKKPKAPQEPKHKFEAADPGKPVIEIKDGVEKVVAYNK